MQEYTFHIIFALFGIPNIVWHRPTLREGLVFLSRRFSTNVSHNFFLRTRPLGSFVKSTRYFTYHRLLIQIVPSVSDDVIHDAYSSFIFYLLFGLFVYLFLMLSFFFVFFPHVQYSRFVKGKHTHCIFASSTAWLLHISLLINWGKFD